MSVSSVASKYVCFWLNLSEALNGLGDYAACLWFYVGEVWPSNRKMIDEADKLSHIYMRKQPESIEFKGLSICGDNSYLVLDF